MIPISVAFCLLTAAILSKRSPPDDASARDMSPYPISISNGSTCIYLTILSGSLSAVATGFAFVKLTSLSFCFASSFRKYQRNPHKPAKIMKGRPGRAGISPRAMSKRAVIPKAFGTERSCFEISLPKSTPVADLVTKIPEATDIRRAGI